MIISRSGDCTRKSGCSSRITNLACWERPIEIPLDHLAVIVVGIKPLSNTIVSKNLQRRNLQAGMMLCMAPKVKLYPAGY